MKLSCKFPQHLAAISIIITILLFTSHGKSFAQWNQTQKLLASDGVLYDNLGDAVAISGSHAIVGAPGKNYPHGAAYIYEKDAGGTWHQVAHLTPGAYERFGYSVAISGNLAVVGSYGLDLQKGRVWLYKRNTSGIWQFVVTFLSGRSYDGFGHSVDISGNNIIAGAPNGGSGARFGQGVVYIFEKGTSWLSGVITTHLVPSDLPGPIFYGNSVAISGNRVIVGANGTLEGTGASAYVYEKNASGTWGLANKLLASDPTTDNNFGASVAISGSRALVGASGSLHTGIQTGAAYLFQRNAAGHWYQVQKLTASDASLYDGFGYSVGLSNTRAAIGAYSNDDSGSGSGSAYVFELNSGTWSQTAKLTASDAAAEDWFGRAVDISGKKVIAGSPSDDDSGNSSGSAYIFEYGLRLPVDCFPFIAFPGLSPGVIDYLCFHIDLRIIARWEECAFCPPEPCLSCPDLFEKFDKVYEVTFSYENPLNEKINLPKGKQNFFEGMEQPDLGQPEVFYPGTHQNVFSMLAAPGQTVHWVFVDEKGGKRTLSFTTPEMLNISIYPNPNNGIFEVKAANAAQGEKALLSIMDFLGNVVVMEEVILPLQKRYDLSKSGKGMYVLKIETGKAVETKKMVVQ